MMPVPWCLSTRVMVYLMSEVPLYLMSEVPLSRALSLLWTQDLRVPVSTGSLLTSSHTLGVDTLCRHAATFRAAPPHVEMLPPPAVT